MYRDYLLSCIWESLYCSLADELQRLHIDLQLGKFVLKFSCSELQRVPVACSWESLY